MSESKVPYRIITAFSYPGGTHYTVRGPGLDEFGDDISYEAAERECPRLNAAFAAGAASRDAEIERLRAEVAELRSESEQMCKELNEVLDANGVTWGSGPNDTYAGHFKLLIERLRAEAYHTAPGELEFGGEGWTWKQQARANEDRLRELEAEVARLGGVVAAAVQAEQAARERVTVLDATIDKCRAAGFLTPEGEAKKVLGTLPLTADGYVVGNGGRFWSPGGTACGYCMAEDHNESHWAMIECYSTREAAEAARKGGAS